VIALRRLSLGGLLAAQLALAWLPVWAQVTIFPDNDARQAIRTLRSDVQALELTLRERINAVEAAAREAGAVAEKRSRDELRASEDATRGGLARLAEQLQALRAENAARAAEFAKQVDERLGVLNANQVVLQEDQKRQLAAQDAADRALEGRLQEADREISALKQGRIAASQALDQLREDVQKWLAPLQSSLDRLTRDLTLAQRTLRDQATAAADIQRKADDAQRKLEAQLKDLDEALRQALTEAGASQEQRLADVLRGSEQKAQALEERLRKAQEDAARRADERLARLDQALRAAEEQAGKAEARIVQAETRIAQAEARLVDADKRGSDADARIAELEGRLSRADAKAAETDSRLAQADERAREADERLGRIDEALRRVEEGLAQGETRDARTDERVLRAESRWRQVDEQARLRGAETDLSPLGQRLGRVEDRLRKLEPVPVVLDGVEFAASADEKRLYDEAIGLMGKTDFDQAAQLLGQFLRRYPASGYTGWVRFWQGHALAGSREHRGAISAFRALVNESPNHPKAAEAMLAMAASQIETKDRVGARKTLEDLLRLYPDSDASKLGRQRLVTMR
jgi:tol-pal system protein YbgF